MSEYTLALFGCKTCGKCGKTKPADAFPRQGRTCRACRRAYSAEHYRRNRENRLAYAAEYAKLNPCDPVKRRDTERRWRKFLKQRGELCSVAECGRVLRNLALRLCDAHYKRFRDSGVVGGAVRERRPAPPDAVCSIAGCNGPHEARGLCRPHYLSQHWTEGTRSSVRRRRARLLDLPAERYTLADILNRDGTACVLCGEELDLAARFPDRRAASVEHLECLSWPGSAGDVLSNVAASHLGCNNSRVNRPHPAAARKRAELLAAERQETA